MRGEGESEVRVSCGVRGEIEAVRVRVRISGEGGDKDEG